MSKRPPDTLSAFMPTPTLFKFPSKQAPLKPNPPPSISPSSLPLEPLTLPPQRLLSSSMPSTTRDVVQDSQKKERPKLSLRLPAQATHSNDSSSQISHPDSNQYLPPIEDQHQHASQEEFIQTRRELLNYTKQLHSSLSAEVDTLNSNLERIDSIFQNSIGLLFEEVKNALYRCIEQEIDRLKQQHISMQEKRKLQYLPELYECKSLLEGSLRQVADQMELLRHQHNWQEAVHNLLQPSFKEHISTLFVQTNQINESLQAVVNTQLARCNDLFYSSILPPLNQQVKQMLHNLFLFPAKSGEQPQISEANGQVVRAIRKNGSFERGSHDSQRKERE